MEPIKLIHFMAGLGYPWKISVDDQKKISEAVADLQSQLDAERQKHARYVDEVAEMAVPKWKLDKAKEEIEMLRKELEAERHVHRAERQRLMEQLRRSRWAQMIIHDVPATAWHRPRIVDIGMTAPRC